MATDFDDDEDDFDDTSSRDEGSGKAGRYKADNSGGYANPPVSGQFKKDNKKGGRKKGVTSLESEIRKRLGQKVAIKTDGERRFMMPREILAQRIMSAVLSDKSTPAMIEYARKLFDEFGPKEEETVPRMMDTAGMSIDEKRLMLAVLDRVFNSAQTPGVTRSIDPQRHANVTGIYKVSLRGDAHVVIEKMSGDDKAS